MELEEQMKAKRVTVLSAIVTPKDNRPCQRSGKKIDKTEDRSKKTKKHAKDRYEKEVVSEDTDSSDQPTAPRCEDIYQPSENSQFSNFCNS